MENTEEKHFTSSLDMGTWHMTPQRLRMLTSELKGTSRNIYIVYTYSICISIHTCIVYACYMFFSHSQVIMIMIAKPVLSTTTTTFACSKL